MSLVRTSCSCCDKALFWGDDGGEPECLTCRELREAAGAGPEVVADEPARPPDDLTTLLSARLALR